MTAVAGSLAPRQLDLENPWPGLDSFEETASDFFHGREAEGDELVRRVIEAPVAVLFGKSGLGKTSLLKAGLFPRMRKRHLLPVYVRLALTPTAPGAHRPGTVRPAVTPWHAKGSMPHRRRTVNRSGSTCTAPTWSCGITQNYQQTPVFVFDQFEEVFTLGESLRTAVQSFRVDFGDLAENRIPALARRTPCTPTKVRRPASIFGRCPTRWS